MSTATAARELPILFSGEMVRAILEGRKTQTRRVVKWKPRREGLNLSFSGLTLGYYSSFDPGSGWVLRSREGMGCWNDRTHPIHCPYGQPGDRLYVRETWRIEDGGRYPGIIRYAADNRTRGYGHLGHAHDAVWLAAGKISRKPNGGWHPSIHMPRIFSRLWLEVVSVRVERVQCISRNDAIAEGASGFREDVYPPVTGRGVSPFIHSFAELWDSINAKRGHLWESHPWVWVVEFKVQPEGGSE